MGCALCRQLEEPIWFSYYGPIREPEAAAAINSTVAEQVQAVGAGHQRIPIRRVVASPLRVPVALNTPPLSEISEETVTVSFSTASAGTLTLQTDTFSSSFEFDVGLKQTHTFPRPAEDTMTVKFEFEPLNGVTARMYSVKIVNGTESSVLSDKMVIDGVVSTISRVYRQQEGENGDEGFSDGLCLICCMETATVVAFPCRHCCMCRACSERFVQLSSRCPFCRAAVVELIECVTPEETV